MSRMRQWVLVIVVILAGVIAAFQIGKAAVALPLLQRDLGLDLAVAALVISAFGTVGAFAGLPAGILAARLPARATIVGGLAVIAAGSALGAVAADGATLLATRVVEGCGFIAIGIAAPRLISALAASGDREIALAGWGAYMPAGSAAMLLAAPAFMDFGWRGLWLGNAVIAAVYALVILVAVPGAPAPRARGPWTAWSDLRLLFAARTPLLLALTFGLYAFQYSALAGLMPTLLVDRLGLTLGQAGLITAATVIANAMGNLAAGALIGFGFAFWAVVAAAFATLGACAIGIFSAAAPVALVAALAALNLAVTGLVPASTYAAGGRGVPPALLAMTFGLILQMSNIGQFFGPAVLGWWAARHGWSSAPLLFGAVAALGIIVALRLRRLPR
ncbi:MAG: MFS transporter [Proteobacteria bacterium]|nr:MFS transporter [Pseudomonadota bacterium]